jgi:hypothetical protein
MHHTTFHLKQAMQRLQANTWSASAHCFIQVGELPHTPKCADDVSECTFAHLLFDCRVITDDVQKDSAQSNHCQYLPDP